MEVYNRYQLIYRPQHYMSSETYQDIRTTKLASKTVSPDPEVLSRPSKMRRTLSLILKIYAK